MAARGALRWPITVTAMTATIMQALDMTIANVALPTMQGSLLTTQDRIAWVLTSYIVTAAIFMPPTGFLAGRFGRRRLFGIAIAGFTVASMLCGIAGSLEEIVLYRVAQGAFGAFLVPLSQAIMLDTWPREQHGSAMAIWSSGVMIGPIVGRRSAAGSPKPGTGAGFSSSTCRSGSWRSRGCWFSCRRPGATVRAASTGSVLRCWASPWAVSS